ncbi:Px [Turnip rosette virus]|uniref:Px n=1 Tax=Turnip rosette virus TaxID=218923 RepID=UPI0003D3ED51|nr:Px [Turnip rosette virus]
MAIGTKTDPKPATALSFSPSGKGSNSFLTKIHKTFTFLVIGKFKLWNHVVIKEYSEADRSCVERNVCRDDRSVCSSVSPREASELELCGATADPSASIDSIRAAYRAKKMDGVHRKGRRPSSTS